MGIAKATIGNNGFIGAFAIATDSYVLISSSSTKTERSILEENLGCRAIGATIDGSGLIGIYAAANSGCVLLPEMTDRLEAQRIRDSLPGVSVEVLETGLNALRNNILANDRVAIVNPEYSNEEAKTIGDLMGVEVIRRRIGGFTAVGANNVLTNRGMALNNSATDEDVEFVKGLGIRATQTTADLGSMSLGLCTVANSKGLVAGDQTTGFELARLAEGLDIE